LTNEALQPKLAKNKHTRGVEEIDDEILKRLPYWIKELLKMVEEIKKEGNKTHTSEKR